jgi:hypothetical protein
MEEGGVCLVDEEVQSEQKAVLLVYAENELGSCKFWCWKKKEGLSWISVFFSLYGFCFVFCYGKGMKYKLMEIR